MIERFIGWMRAEALPFWAQSGFDADRGWFHERLDRAGNPLLVPHRAMVQARQIFSFAHATRLGWVDAAEPARRAMATLQRLWCQEDASGVRIAFAIDPATGTVVAPKHDAYTYAFVLFAAAHLHLLDRDPQWLDFADRVTRFVERELSDPDHGGVINEVPLETPAKKQNPQMHLLEAWLALDEAAPDRGYRERATRVVALLRDRMISGDPPVLPETFDPDWQLPSGTREPIFEPGHHFEWAWLLGEADRVTGENNDVLRDRLFDIAVRRGIAANGLLVDGATASGVAVPSHRLWPHTEAIKAAGARGDRDLGDRMAAGLIGHFLGRPLPGGWIDQLASDGHPLVDYIPASSLYHLTVAASEAERRFGSAGRP